MILNFSIPVLNKQTTKPTFGWLRLLRERLQLQKRGRLAEPGEAGTKGMEDTIGTGRTQRPGSRQLFSSLCALESLESDSKQRSGPPPPEILIQWVWGGLRIAFQMHCHTVLMLLARGHTLGDTGIGQRVVAGG